MGALPKVGRVGFTSAEDTTGEYLCNDFSRIVLDLDCDSLTFERGEQVFQLKLSDLKNLSIGIKGVTGTQQLVGPW